jgi:hypothetical protein
MNAEDITDLAKLKYRVGLLEEHATAPPPPHLKLKVAVRDTIAVLKKWVSDKGTCLSEDNPDYCEVCSTLPMLEEAFNEYLKTDLRGRNKLGVMLDEANFRPSKNDDVILKRYSLEEAQGKPVERDKDNLDRVLDVLEAESFNALKHGPGDPYLVRNGGILRGEKITQWHRANGSASYHCTRCGAELRSTNGNFYPCWNCNFVPMPTGISMRLGMHDEPPKPDKTVVGTHFVDILVNANNTKVKNDEPLSFEQIVELAEPGFHTKHGHILGTRRSPLMPLHTITYHLPIPRSRWQSGSLTPGQKLMPVQNMVIDAVVCSSA